MNKETQLCGRRLVIGDVEQITELKNLEREAELELERSKQPAETIPDYCVTVSLYRIETVEITVHAFEKEMAEEDVLKIAQANYPDVDDIVLEPHLTRKVESNE